MSTSSDRSSVEARLSPGFLALVYVNAFVTGAVVMGFEMLGSRYLNPVFGSGIYTWAALISTVLAALTAGYFFGGWMADRNPKPAGLGWLILGGSIYLGVIPLFADDLLELVTALLGAVADQREFERWGSIAGAMLLLFVPLALLGVYSPYAIRLTLRATTRSGRVAGRIYGISTLGSIFGTLFVTFYLIPAMGSRHITFLLAGLGIAAGLSFLAARPAALGRAARVTAGALLLAAFAAAPPPALAEPPDGVTLAQDNAARAGERFIAYLKKEGAEIRYGAIEPGTTPGSFRIKDAVFAGPDGGEWRAASLEAAAFEEKNDGEAALTGALLLEFQFTNPDKTVAKIARLGAEFISWSKGGHVATRGVSVRDVAITSASGETARIGAIEIAQWRLDGKLGGVAEQVAARDIAFSSKRESGTVGAVTLESAVVEVPKRIAVKNLAVRDFVATPPGQGIVRIGALELRELDLRDFATGTPADVRAFEFALSGLDAPVLNARDPMFEQEMRALGYTSLKMNAAIVYRYEEASRIFNLAKLEFDLADVATATFAFKLSGITPEDIKKSLEPQPAVPGDRPGARPPMAAMGLLARLNLVSADLSYRDKSILGRVIKREAERRQTDEASIRAQYRAMLIALRDEQSDALMREAFDAVIAFLESPGELIVEVRPPTPMNVLAISALAASNPAQLRTALGIKITAKRP